MLERPEIDQAERFAGCERRTDAGRARADRAISVAALAGALVLAALFFASASARADVSGPDIVGFLNAQRAAHGIPADIAEDGELSSGCRLHNHYGALNNELTHEEDPAKPGYTPEGAQAGRTSVLYGAGPWTATSNPFEYAPIHLHQLLAPRISALGAWESEGYGCATTLARRERPAPATNITYTYPRDGATAWRFSEIARESPYTPGQLLGIPQGTTTGPYLYVMFDGPDLTADGDAKVSSASLTGPSGSVELLVADNTTPQLVGYLPPGAELIPRNPLAPETRYTATVAATAGGQAFTHSWSFTTGVRANSVLINGYRGGGGNAFTFTVQSDAPGGSLTATGPGAPITAPIGADGKATITLRVGTWRVCASTGGPGTGYAPAQNCFSQPVTVTPPPFATKLEVRRASVLRSARRLSVLAPITARASGQVRAAFEAAGRTDRFTASVDVPNRRVRFDRRIAARQARLGTGILTLTYAGDSDTQPQQVRLRAASRKANLNAQRPNITNGRLTAQGTLTTRARGVVRLQLLYEPAAGQTRTLEYQASINNGRYRFDHKLPADVVSGIATRRGVVHSYTLFTGYFKARVRGEMSSYQVLPQR